MPLSDYIPNITSAPVGYEGLLGADPTRKLEKQANLQGLLGVAASLAQGMSSQGPRRSALQNILGSLSSGYGATQQAYQGGLQQYGQQQQIAQANRTMALQQQKDAVMQKLQRGEQLTANDYAILNPEEAAKVQFQKMRMADLYQTTPQGEQKPQFTQPSARDQFAMLSGVTSTDALYPVEVTPNKSAIQQQIDMYRQANAKAATTIGGIEAEKIIDNNNKIIKDLLSKQESESVSTYDLTDLENSVVPLLKPAVTQLRAQMADGLLKASESQKAIADIQKANFDYQVKQQDYTNESIRVAKGIFPDKSINDLTGAQLAKVQARLQEEAKARGKSSASTINFADKTLAVKRMDQQAAAEEAANNAQNAASDVRAIVDILKPYKGGRLDEFKAQLGGFFPDTSLAQLSTANDAANAIRAKLAPTLRVVGSGTTSDMETKQFLASLPSLMSYPEGRELAAVYAQRFADRATAAADIKYQMIQDGTYTSRAFQNELKAAGFERILTADDIAILQGKKKAGFVPSRELEDAVKKHLKK